MGDYKVAGLKKVWQNPAEKSDSRFLEGPTAKPEGLRRSFSPLAPAKENRVAATGETWLPTLAKRLFLVTAREWERRQAQEKTALLHQVFSLKTSSSQDWGNYRKWLEEQFQGTEGGRVDLKAWLQRAPEVRGTPLESLFWILQEKRSDRVAASLLELGRRYAGDPDGRELAFHLFQVAKEHPATRCSAQRWLDLMAGGGGFGEKFEYLSGTFIREFISPLSLASFGMTVLAGRVASLGILSRATQMNLDTFLLSETAALAAEVPTYVLSHRVGLKLFSGGKDLFSPQAIGRELLVTFGPFALLKGYGNAVALGAPALRRLAGLARPGGISPLLGNLLEETGRLGGEVGAVMAGHGLNQILGLEPKNSPETSLFLSSLLTVAQIRAASGMLETMLPNRLGTALGSQKTRLLQKGAQDLFAQAGIGEQHPWESRLKGELADALDSERVGALTLSRWVRFSRRGLNHRVETELEAKGLPLLAMEFGRRSEISKPMDPGGISGILSEPLVPVEAGVPPRGRFDGQDPNRGRFLSQGQGGGGGSDSSSYPPGSSKRSYTVVELVRKKLGAFLDAQEKSDLQERLTQAAKRLNNLWNDRWSRDPDSAKDPSFHEELAAVDRDLAEAKRAREQTGKSLQELRAVLEEALSEEEISGPSNPLEGEVFVKVREKPDSEPKGFLSRWILNSVGPALVGFRDMLKMPFSRKVNPPPDTASSVQENFSSMPTMVPGRDADAPPVLKIPPPPPLPDLEKEEMDFGWIQEQIRLKEEEEQGLDEIIGELTKLRRLMVVANLTQRGRERMNSAIGRLNNRMSGRLKWRIPTFPDVSPASRSEGEKWARGRGALLGLGVQRRWLTTDSPMARQLRRDLPPDLNHPNMDLEMMHHGISLAAQWKGGAHALKRRLAKLSQEYGAEPDSQAAVTLTGETLFGLIRGKTTVDSLLQEIQGGTDKRMKGAVFESLSMAIHPSIKFSEALHLLGSRPGASHILRTGLWTLLRAEGDPQQLMDFIQMGKQEGLPGFHPTISASFFGAAHGANRLPPQLFSKNFDPEVFLNRVFEEFTGKEI